jgi:hypothetical protein
MSPSRFFPGPGRITCDWHYRPRPWGSIHSEKHTLKHQSSENGINTKLLTMTADSRGVFGGIPKATEQRSSVSYDSLLSISQALLTYDLWYRSSRGHAYYGRQLVTTFCREKSLLPNRNDDLLGLRTQSLELLSLLCPRYESHHTPRMGSFSPLR